MRVLLVHGLGRSPISMVLLAARLANSGHRPAFFAYSPVFEHDDRIVSRMETRLRRLAAEGAEVGLVGHSFGGLVLREALARVPELRVRHLVMLGTPNQLPRLAVRARQWLPYRVLRRSCGDRLACAGWFDRLPSVSSPCTVVAGTAGWRGSRSPFRDEVNDGLVAVSETVLRQGERPVLFPTLHTWLMNDRAVYRLIAERFRDA